MFKKLIFWSALVVGGLVLINNVKPGAVATFGKRIHARIEKKVSPEFELARIKDQIRELTPDMHKHIGQIAQEMVAVESLKSKVESTQVRLDGQKAEIQAMTTALEKGERYVSAGRPLTPSTIKVRLKSYEAGERELATQKKMLDAKQQSLEAARQQLSEIKRQKEELEVVVAQFEAEVQSLKLEQTRSKFQLDDSRLAEIKGSLEKLRERVETERRKVDLTAQFIGTGSLKAEKASVTAEDVIAEVREKFETDSSAKK